MLSTSVLTVLLASPFFVAASDSHTAHRRHHNQAIKRDDAIVVAPVAVLATTSACTTWYTVTQGEYCYKLAESHGITLDQFYAMNPDVDSNCSNLWSGNSYCVSNTPG